MKKTLDDFATEAMKPLLQNYLHIYGESQSIYSNAYISVPDIAVENIAKFSYQMARAMQIESKNNDNS